MPASPPFQTQAALTHASNARAAAHRALRVHGVSTPLVELQNLATVAEITVACALQRRESRGGHFCVDYPDMVSVCMGVWTCVQEHVRKCAHGGVCAAAPRELRQLSLRQHNCVSGCVETQQLNRCSTPSTHKSRALPPIPGHADRGKKGCIPGGGVNLGGPSDLAAT